MAERVNNDISAALKWAPLIGVAALVLGAVRYLLQATGNIYSNLGQKFYLPDPDLGWVESADSWVWVGLDAGAIVVSAMIGTLVAVWLTRRLRDKAQRSGKTVSVLARLTLAGACAGALLCVLAPAFPIWAFLSGFPPAGAQATLPSTPTVTVMAADSGDAKVELEDLTAGRYVIQPHERANTLVAQVAAGGEAFDAKFSPLEGSLTIDPAALETTAEKIRVSAATIDTGIELRSSHSREDLKVEEFPELSVELDGLTLSNSALRRTLNASGTVTVSIMGKALKLPLTGTVESLSSDKRTRLDVSGAPALLVQATLQIPLESTPLDASSFDTKEIGVTVRFILTPDTAKK